MNEKFTKQHSFDKITAGQGRQDPPFGREETIGMVDGAYRTKKKGKCYKIENVVLEEPANAVHSI